VARTLPLARPLLWLTLSCSALLGCGVEFDPPTEVKSLRILGVQKDKPYAQQGDAVSFKMLWHDGSPKVDATDPTKRAIEIGWFGPCINPPFDSYAACGQALQVQSANDDPSDDLVIGAGATFQVHVPERSDLLHANQDPKQPPYAVMYVFFAACAGKLGPSTDPTFPAGCYAASDTSFATPLGSDDFVAGYSAIYVFEKDRDYRNANPVIGGFVVNTSPVNDAAVVCEGDACLGTCDDGGVDGSAGPCHNAPPLVDDSDADAVAAYCTAYPKYCVPPCADDGDPIECPGYDVHPSMDRSQNSEPDQITNENYGHNYGEQMWIDYYSSRGALGSATKLLNDATSGWNSGYGTNFYAPSKKGAVSVWAAVHDNRGGVAWAGTTIVVR